MLANADYHKSLVHRYVIRSVNFDSRLSLANNPVGRRSDPKPFSYRKNMGHLPIQPLYAVLRSLGDTSLAASSPVPFDPLQFGLMRFGLMKIRATTKPTKPPR